MAMDDAIEQVDLPTVRKMFEEFGQSFSQRASLSEYDVRLVDGVQLIMHRRLDDAEVTIEMTDSTEVFFLSLANTYRMPRTAYNDADKWEALHDLLAVAEQFLQGDYVEEFRERKGKLIPQSIRCDGDDGLVLSANGGLLGWIWKLMGYEIRTTRP